MNQDTFRALLESKLFSNSSKSIFPNILFSITSISKTLSLSFGDRKYDFNTFSFEKLVFREQLLE